MSLVTFTVALNELDKAKNGTTTTYQPPTAPLSKPPEDFIYRIDITVLLPESPQYMFSLNRTLPAIQLAKESQEALYPNLKFHLKWFDTKCDAQAGPIAAIDQMINRSVDAFIGPACSYSAAPLGRFARHWGKPVITAGAAANPFSAKSEYFLTRTHVVYNKMGVALAGIILDQFKWKHYSILKKLTRDITDQECYFTMNALHEVVNERLRFTDLNDTIGWYGFVDEDELAEYLQDIKTKYRGESPHSRRVGVIR